MDGREAGLRVEAGFLSGRQGAVESDDGEAGDLGGNHCSDLKLSLNE